MTPAVKGHPWSKESLFCKARLYVEQMEAHTADDWKFGFWSALSLELLARAALAHISPVLLADNKNWRNLAHALGESPKVKGFSPKSLSTREVLCRLAELVPAFNDEIHNFCTKHTERRNSELHSAELSFENLETSEWLPKFYSSCKALLESMDRELADFVSEPAESQEMINSLKDATAKAVKQDINDYKQVWSKKDNSEQDKASFQATTWATRHAGHRVNCPSCNSKALLQGIPSGTVTTEVSGEEVIQRQTLLPSSFKCIACGLHISGLSKLSACGLGNAFNKKSTYTAAEFFNLYTEDELYEPDFNEY